MSQQEFDAQVERQLKVVAFMRQLEERRREEERFERQQELYWKKRTFVRRMRSERARLWSRF